MIPEDQRLEIWERSDDALPNITPAYPSEILFCTAPVCAVNRMGPRLGRRDSREVAEAIGPPATRIEPMAGLDGLPGRAWTADLGFEKAGLNQALVQVVLDGYRFVKKNGQILGSCMHGKLSSATIPGM